MAKRRTKGQVIIEYTVLFAIVAAVTALSTAAIFSRVCRSEGRQPSAFERYFQAMSQRIAPHSVEDDTPSLPNQRLTMSEEERQASGRIADGLADAKRSMQGAGVISSWRTEQYQEQIDDTIENLGDNPDRFAPTVVNESFGGRSNELEPYDER